jgi:hypothetical protein
MLRDDEIIASLCRDLDLELDCYNYQFLWLLPIIEVMWADGHCQKEEIETLFHYVEAFVKLVRRDVPQITSERARLFFLPLLEKQALNDPRKRAYLSMLVSQIIKDVVEPSHQDKRSKLFHICAEVAAAARNEETGDPLRPIAAEEARLLKALFHDLRLGDVG